MRCKSCGSDALGQFPAEINIHFPGVLHFETPTVWAFPQLTVCLKCGWTELVLADTVVRTLKETISGEGGHAA